MHDEASTAPGDPERGDDLPYRVHLRPGRERSVLRRHPWLFSGAIAQIEATEEARPGDMGRILSSDGRVLGVGLVNPNVALTVRLLSGGTTVVDRAWMHDRIAAALALRERVTPPETTAVRLINAEGDGLPGLVADRYADVVVVQCLALGMARMEEFWLPELVAQSGARVVLDRSDQGRGDANLPRRERHLHGPEPPERVEVREHGARLWIDLTAGQKTGFFVDQRENRVRVAALAKGARVLNAFAYTGAFSVHAGRQGALRVVNVDTSPAALDLARENWALNDLPADRLETVRRPVQDYLREEAERFDLIFLDPPAFAKEKGHVERAARAYKDANLWAMKRLSPGGVLATFSCSQHVDGGLFQKIVFGASLDAGRSLQWIARLGAGPDHPVHLDHPQGEYLKGLLLRALD